MRSNLNCRKTSINVYFDRNTAQPKRDFFCTAMDMAGTRVMMKNIYWIITQIILDMAYVDGLVQDRWNVTPSLTHWSNICQATKHALIQNRFSIKTGFAPSIEATNLDLAQNGSIQNLFSIKY